MSQCRCSAPVLNAPVLQDRHGVAARDAYDETKRPFREGQRRDEDGIQPAVYSQEACAYVYVKGGVVGLHDRSTSRLRRTLSRRSSAFERPMPAAKARDVEIVVSGPYSSGILAGGSHFEYSTNLARAARRQ